jgi:signal transduction histidine kinase
MRQVIWNLLSNAAEASDSPASTMDVVSPPDRHVVKSW